MDSPELPQGDDQEQAAGSIPALHGPAHGGAQVAVLDLQPAKPVCLLRLL